jgi:tol-pal system protein YbgF
MPYAIRPWSALLLGACLLAGCETTPPGPDPTQVKINDIDERLGRVERVVSNQSLLTLSQRIDVLEAQLRELRGTVEELQNSNEALRKQQRDLYADLDRRIKVLEAALKGGAVAPMGGSSLPLPPSSGAGPAPAADDQQAYNRAFDALKNSDYNGAIAQFRDFLRLYPHSALADNAQYWLGEGYYVTRDYDDAMAAFRAVGEQYPQSRKAPDALLKIGFAQYELRHMADARATLSLVVQKYPGTDAARLAADRLTRIPLDAP